VIENPVPCRILSVICLLHTKNMTALEIHCELSMVYAQNVMSEGTVKWWCRIFKDGQTNTHNEEQIDWPSVVSE
jgi:hypothetical protein